jgi:hypothetical protein
MPVTLRILNANDILTNHQETLMRTEELSFVLLSLAVGHESGSRANLVTLLQDPATPPTIPISLSMIDGSLDQAAQQAGLNSGGKQIVCFGSLYVQGQACNILAYRDVI